MFVWQRDQGEEKKLKYFLPNNLKPRNVTSLMAQAAAGLSEKKLEEYKSIFSFFDR